MNKFCSIGFCLCVSNENHNHTIFPDATVLQVPEGGKSLFKQDEIQHNTHLWLDLMLFGVLWVCAGGDVDAPSSCPPDCWNSPPSGRHHWLLRCRHLSHSSLRRTQPESGGAPQYLYLPPDMTMMPRCELSENRKAGKWGESGWEVAGVLDSSSTTTSGFVLPPILASTSSRCRRHCLAFLFPFRIHLLGNSPLFPTFCTLLILAVST